MDVVGLSGGVRSGREEIHLSRRLDRQVRDGRGPNPSLCVLGSETGGVSLLTETSSVEVWRTTYSDPRT